MSKLWTRTAADWSRRTLQAVAAVVECVCPTLLCQHRSTEPGSTAAGLQTCCFPLLNGPLSYNATAILGWVPLRRVTAVMSSHLQLQLLKLCDEEIEETTTHSSAALCCCAEHQPKSPAPAQCCSFYWHRRQLAKSFSPAQRCLSGVDNAG